MSTHSPAVPTGSPPSWMNTMMSALLRTPVLQQIIGRSVALVTVTGRRTGREYTFPVSYHLGGDTVLVITKRSRTWWQNLASCPQVGLRLAGKQYGGNARIVPDGPDALALLTTFVEHRRFDAKAFGITFAPNGHVDQHRAQAVLPQLVILQITLAGRTPRPHRRGG